MQEGGKPLEIDGLMASVIEIAELTQIPVPNLRTVYALVKLLDQSIAERSRKEHRPVSKL